MSPHEKAILLFPRLLVIQEIVVIFWFAAGWMGDSLAVRSFQFTSCFISFARAIAFLALYTCEIKREAKSVMELILTAVNKFGGKCPLNGRFYTPSVTIRMAIFVLLELWLIRVSPVP